MKRPGARSTLGVLCLSLAACASSALPAGGTAAPATATPEVTSALGAQAPDASASAEPSTRAAEVPGASDVDCAWARVQLVTDQAKLALESCEERSALDLELTDATDETLRSVTKLPWLTSLTIHGEIHDLTPLTKLPNLRRLDCTFCSELVDIGPLAELPELEELILTSSPQVDDLGPLASAKKLRVLRLSNFTRDLSPIAGLTELRDLGVVNVEDPVAIAGLTNLERLKIVFSGVHDLNFLRGMSHLRELDLGENEKLVDISAVAGMPDLESITLIHTAVSDLSPLAKLKKLRNAWLSGSKVRDFSPLMASAATLETVSVGAVPPGAYAALSKANPKIKFNSN